MLIKMKPSTARCDNEIYISCEYRIGKAKVALKTLRKLWVGSDDNKERLLMDLWEN